MWRSFGGAFLSGWGLRLQALFIFEGDNMKNNFEYLLSRHYLNKLIEAKALSYDEFDRIDDLNKRRFLHKEEEVKHKKDVISSNNVLT